mgnify:CR=1 FL=1
MKEEKWLDIKGYENLYKVSNLGRVIKVSKNRVLAESKYSDGYRYYSLSKNGKSKKFKSHRLLALHFLSNPENKKQVNHIDGIKYNNDLSNLEWVTQSENILHSYKIGTQKPLKGSDNVLSFRVYQYGLDGKFIQSFGSGRDAARKLGLYQSNISACCLGKIKSSGGFNWSYEN